MASDNVERTLGRVEAKLDILLEDRDSIHHRVGALEEARTKLLTLAAVVSTVVGAAWSYLLHNYRT